MPPVIEVKNLTKEYRLGALASIKDTLRHGLAKVTGKKDLAWERQRFKALDDVSFSIEEGEVVGIIGHNGAGKSTLLKHLANITKPTSGEVIVRGSVAPLIEVGAGVNPELTGRENIYLNGAILGIPKKVIDQKIDEIIEFSELEQFIDTPVKRYSSGMTVKLGFSIATSMDADILIIDEVLAVGDLAFQRKCFDRMEDLIKRHGKTVLVVSHNIRQIQRLSDRVMLLDHGKIDYNGKSLAGCERFYKQSNANIAARQKDTAPINVRSSGQIDFHSIHISDGNVLDTRKLTMHEPASIRCIFDSKVEIDNPEIAIGFHTTDFIYVSTMTNIQSDQKNRINRGTNIIDCELDSLPLMPGQYALRFAILDNKRNELFYAEQLDPFSVIAGTIPQSKLPALGLVHIPARWMFR